MNQITYRLPNGKDVEVRSVSIDLENGATGYIARDLLAEDPDQPRMFFGEEELEELTGSIAAEGVRVPLVITPASKAPWVNHKPGQEDRPFIIVSGNRRWICAGRAGIEVVPYRLEVYENEDAHRTAADIYNGPRSNLSEIEQAYEMAHRRKAGATLEQIALSKGRSINHVIRRLNLVKLAPNIRAELGAEANSKKRTFPITVAEDLGSVEAPQLDELFEILDEFGLSPDESYDTEDSLRFGLQNALLSVIRRERFNANRAREFIETRRRSVGSSGAHKRYVDSHKPSRRIDLVRSLIDGITGTPMQDWPREEWERVFYNADRAGILNVLSDIENAQQILSGIRVILERIAEKKPEVRNPDPNGNRGLPHGVARDEKSGGLPKRPPIPMRPRVIRSLLKRGIGIDKAPPRKVTGPPIVPPPTPHSRTRPDEFVPFSTEIWDGSIGCFVLTKVESREKCRTLFDSRHFRFQRGNTELPTGFPDDLRNAWLQAKAS